MAKKEYPKDNLPPEGPEVLPKEAAPAEAPAPQVIAPGLKFNGKPKYWDGVVAEMVEVLAGLGAEGQGKQIALALCDDPAKARQLASLAARAPR